MRSVGGSRRPQATREGSGSGRRIICLGDRPYDDDSARTSSQNVVEPVQVEATDGEPRPRSGNCRRSQPRRLVEQVQPRSRSAGFGRRGPDRPDAEVVKVRIGDCGGQLRIVVSRESNASVRTDDASYSVHGQIPLTNVKHRRARDSGEVGTVIDRPQRAVASGCVGDDLQRRELFSCLEMLLAQLYDVDTRRQHGVEELAQVTLATAPIDAQIKARVGERIGRHRQRGYR
jgi:hypothetical protein